MEWLETRIGWGIENNGFSTWTSSTIGWTGCDAFATTTTCYLDYVISTIGSTGSTWMLSITWSRWGSCSSYMLPYVTIAWNSFPPPPPILSEHVCSSSSFDSTTYDLKVVLDLFFNGQVTFSRLNLSLGVGNYVHVFRLWHWHLGKGEVVVECVSLFSFKKCSLMTGSGETYYFWATCCFWLANDTSFFGVVVFGEISLDNGNHFLNKIYRISHK